MNGFRNDGFTLLEVLLSLAIMTIAVLAVFRLQAQNLDLQSEAGFLTLGSQLGQQRMAEIAARTNLSEGQSSGDFGELYPAFRYEEEIARVAGTKHLWKVRLVVREEGDSGARRILLETRIYRYAS
ncbi:MAG: prepilin-type N-terminal cleavage/methylation domain-containing protein [Thermodesulfobacteriota bacterium]